MSFGAPAAKKGHRVLLYGTGGIGKSVLAAQAPGPVACLDVEESLGILKVQLEEHNITIPLCAEASDWATARATLRAAGWEKVKTIVGDTATKLEEFAIADTIRRVKTEKGGTADGIEGYGYGKGYQYVFETFLPLLADLDVHVRAGRNVILIAHECTTNVPNPQGADWIRYEPRLQSPNSGKSSIRLRVKEWADHVLFLGYDVAVDKEGKAKGSGSRTLYTQEQPFCMAKSRTCADSYVVEMGQGAGIWEAILR